MLRLATLIITGGLAVAAPFSGCIRPQNEGLPYHDLPSANWTGEISGFCESYFAPGDLVFPVENFTCSGDGSQTIRSLWKLMGGLAPKCQSFVGQVACLYHLPILSGPNQLVLPCTRAQSVTMSTHIFDSDTLQTFFNRRCQSVGAEATLNTLSEILNRFDSLIQAHVELRSSCHVVDGSWIPDFQDWSCPSPLSQSESTDLRTDEISCVEPCPSTAFSDSHWDKIRFLILVPNTISFVAILCIVYHRRKASSNMSRCVSQLLICIGGIHVAIGISTVAEMFPNKSVFSLSCISDHTAANSHQLMCGLQGTLLVYFIKACLAWWFVIVLKMQTSLGAKQNDSTVLSFWFGYVYPILWVVMALATESIHHTEEYAWCFVSSRHGGFWQYWFVFGDMTIMVVIAAIATAVRPRSQRSLSVPAKCHNLCICLGVYGLLVWLAMLSVRFQLTAKQGEIETEKNEWLSCLFESVSGSDLPEVCQRAVAPHATPAFFATIVLCFFGLVASAMGYLTELEVAHVVGAFTFLEHRVQHHFRRSSNSIDHKNAMAVFGIAKTPAIDSDGAHCFDFVILGGGTAALFAARKFAEHKEQYSVAVVSKEANTPFCPKILVQALADHSTPTVAIMQDEQWFRDNGIVLMLNTNITSANMKDRLLNGVRQDVASGVTSKIRIRAVRALILAMGAQPVPGPQLLSVDNVPKPESEPYPDLGNNLSYKNPINGYFMLRTYDAGLKINRCLERATHVVVVGGGFLGLDVAYIAKNRGLQVTLVCSSAYVLRRIFTPEMSVMYQNFFASHGVKLVMSNQCTHVLTSKGSVVGVRLRDGQELKCDMCVVACGVAPNVELARGQLQLEKGTNTPAILVDSYLVTSVPGVFAIGDVCAMRYAQHNPGAIRHCSNARLGGSHVVDTLLGAMRNNAQSRVQTPKGAVERPQQDQILELLRPEMGARPFVPHPAYDVNHFHFKGYVTGDRLGPDFIMVGTDMGPNSKMLTLWLWESRVVGAYVSNPTPEEKELLDEATQEQWFIQQLPKLRAMSDAHEALCHIKSNHVL